MPKKKSKEKKTKPRRNAPGARHPRPPTPTRSRASAFDNIGPPYRREMAECAEFPRTGRKQPLTCSALAR
jgi:hypothetical protein